MNKLKPQLPDVWGGIECTINRVEHRYTDQLALSGFYDHPDYLDPIIGLGIKHLRFPILWERHQPTRSGNIDWTFTTDCLHKLRMHRVTPVAGLLHHGSGPAFTNLLQDDFPQLFAAYAAAVAQQFPWLDYYTPVNEPLTTARFSGLYGLWYPHKRNDVSFIKILLNELKATVLAMREIRKINPAAKLVQTEDLSKTYSTPLLSYQARFENHRRWLAFDILCGKFDAKHPLWNYVRRLGIDTATLDFFQAHVCPPDIIGVNHYVTSERYLDENTDRYPSHSAGGNGLHQYADVDAVRVPINEPHGLPHLLEETWSRYQLPLVITEAHLNCTREEQLRWFKHVYSAAADAREHGIDVRAVTMWALLGSFGWNKLLTGETHDYETGAFDISAGYIRPTALATMARRFVVQEGHDHHLLASSGWWKMPSRFYEQSRKALPFFHPDTVQPVLITGKTGTLGQAFSRLCIERNLHHVLTGREEIDICDEQQVADAIKRYKPWAVINTAGYVHVDHAERQPERCYRENYMAASNLAAVCSRHGIKLLSFSSDLVFGGGQQHPYVEKDRTGPLNIYGHSKRLAEKAILSHQPNALIVRTAAFFGPWDHYHFVHAVTSALQAGATFVASNEQVVSPTYVPHLVHACLDLLIDDVSGIWHLVNDGCLTWYAFARKIATMANLDSRLIIAGNDLKQPAKRPEYSALCSNRYQLMPSLDEALTAYFSACNTHKQSFAIQKITNESV